MRTFTNKDREGLLVAFRAFLRALSGERLSPQAGKEIISTALDTGITVDELLNKENWGRALEAEPELNARKYVEILIGNKIEVRSLKEEPMWYDQTNGFPIVSEAAHDFYKYITDFGGKWNIPSTMNLLAVAIRTHSLQDILSEETIMKIITGKEAKISFHTYLTELNSDIGSLQIGQGLSVQQETRRQAMITGESLQDGPHEVIDETLTVIEDEEYNDMHPEDEPYPETGFETTFITQTTPKDMKRDSIKAIMENYSPNELLQVVKTIEGGETKPVSDIIDSLTKGEFNPSLETAEGKNIHQSMNADLMPSFIECVRYQGLEMDEEIASNYDILKTDWDLRAPEDRKLQKMRMLVIMHGDNDPDLLEAVADLEAMYQEAED